MQSEASILKHAKEVAKLLKMRPLRISFRQGVEVGWPDLFVFGPNRYILGVETKKPREPATPMQLERAREMSMFGHGWCKPDTKKAVSHSLVNFASYAVANGDARIYEPLDPDEAVKVVEELQAEKRKKMN